MTFLEVSGLVAWVLVGLFASVVAIEHVAWHLSLAHYRCPAGAHFAMRPWPWYLSFSAFGHGWRFSVGWKRERDRPLLVECATAKRRAWVAARQGTDR